MLGLGLGVEKVHFVALTETVVNFSFTVLIIDFVAQNI